MVLDLRLVKIGCRETINFFLHLHKKRGAGDVSPQVYRRNRIIRQLKFLETSLQAAQPPYFEIAIQRHVPPAMQDVYGWLVDEPCPTAP